MMRNFLRAPNTPGLVLGDAVRIVGLLSVAIAALWWDPTDAGILAFTFPGLLFGRFLGLRPSADIFAGVTLLLAAWSNIFDLYTSIPWWDIPLHFFGTAVLAAMAYVAAAQWGIVPDAEDSATRTLGVVVVTVSFGLALSVLWEIVEWAGFTFISDQIVVAYADTIGDMAVGGLGAVAAGFAVAYARLDGASLTRRTRLGLDTHPTASPPNASPPNATKENS